MIRAVRSTLVPLLFVACLSPARADDFGPASSVREVRWNAVRLLAHRVRSDGIEPGQIQITDVVVVRDQAILTWRARDRHGVMGLVRSLDRWWDALDAQLQGSCWRSRTAFPLDQSGLSRQTLQSAATHNADMRTRLQPACPTLPGDNAAPPLLVHPAGGVIHPLRTTTAGYDITLQYTRNDAAPGGVPLALFYGRAPTAAEVLPNPAPPHGWGGPTNVFFFNIVAKAASPITFAAGTTVQIWFPFVLDDSVQYRLSYVSAGTFSASFHGTIFDNVLTFSLPAFSLVPGVEFQAEVEGFS